MSASSIAETIYKACKGLGTDDKALIGAIAACDNRILMEVTKVFQSQYGYLLHEFLEKELSGKYKKLMMAVTKPRALFEAEQVRAALAGAGTAEKVLIDIILARSPEEIRRMAAAYFTKYHRQMIEDLRNDLSKDTLGRMLIAVASAGREEGPADPSRVASDVAKLHKAAKGLGTDDDVFIMIMCSRSPAHFRAVAAAYEATHGKRLRKVIKSEFRGDEEDGFVTIHDYLLSPAKSTAFLIHRALKGIGTDDDALIRVVATRYDKDVDVAAYYAEKYGDIVKDLKSDLTGSMEKFVLALLQLA